MKLSRTYRSEITLAVGILFALVMLINPAHLIMTSVVLLTLIMIFAVLIIAFGIFIWGEQPRDEREAFNGLRAGRISSFAGGGILVIAIITQAFSHKLDIWLPVALAVMVIAKLLMSAHSRNH
jgi:hypothetical protein